MQKTQTSGHPVSDKVTISMLDNLNEIKEKGMDSFLASQTAKYTCPPCGGFICVHKGRA